MIQLLLFGALDALILTQGPDQSWPVMALFVVGELGVMAAVCSLIVRQFGNAHVPDVLTTAVTGFIVSHLGILAVLHLGHIGSLAPRMPGQSPLAWMELTLHVGLAVVLISAIGVLLKPRVRKHTASAATARKHTATA
ncbi:MAG: hypothetical protein JWN43_1338 [Gammaproteobacteria bacterium]|nr:hypothetical protein [Gammaproteobacteria bacterium]